MENHHRPPLVIGNWKMNGTRESVHSLLCELKKNIHMVPSAVRVVVLPSFVYLKETQHLLAGTHVKWGAQNLHTEEKGAFTGEISAPMLREFGCTYVLVGHSERRRYHFESDDLVAEKFQAAFRADLQPILCVGESQEERHADKTFSVIRRQLEAVLNVVGISSFKRAVIAYEPVWAIGTGQNATPTQAEAVQKTIRGWLAERNRDIAEQICILYGGSITALNAKELFAMPNVDGGLVGGASLKAEEFLKICVGGASALSKGSI